jgi:hypothetical protein
MQLAGEFLFDRSENILEFLLRRDIKQISRTNKKLLADRRMNGDPGERSTR